MMRLFFKTRITTSLNLRMIVTTRRLYRNLITVLMQYQVEIMIKAVPKVLLASPDWEDMANRKGGRWVVNTSRQEVDRDWVEVIMGMVGQQVGEEQDICFLLQVLPC